MFSVFDGSKRGGGLHDAGADGTLDRGVAVGVGIEIETDRCFIALERLDKSHRIIKRPVILAAQSSCRVDGPDFVTWDFRPLLRLEGGAPRAVDTRRPFDGFNRRVMPQQPTNEMVKIRPR